MNNFFDEIESNLDTDKFEILFCAGGTDVGFMYPAYRLANKRGYKTSSYLTAKIYDKEFTKAYSLYNCDETIVAIPSSEFTPPGWHDVSQAFVDDADIHVLLGKLDSGMKISLLEHNLAIDKQLVDDNFKSYQFDLITWD